MPDRYCTEKDIERTGLPADALEGIDKKIILEHIERASGRINSYARAQYTVPLRGVDDVVDEAIVEATAILASYSLLVWRGFRPDEADEEFGSRYRDLIGRPGQKGWLERLADGSVKIAETQDQTPAVVEGAPTFDGGGSTLSSDDRGWAADAYGCRTTGRI